MKMKDALHEQNWLQRFVVPPRSPKQMVWSALGAFLILWDVARPRNGEMPWAELPFFIFPGFESALGVCGSPLAFCEGLRGEVQMVSSQVEWGQLKNFTPESKLSSSWIQSLPTQRPVWALKPLAFFLEGLRVSPGL